MNTTKRNEIVEAAIKAVNCKALNDEVEHFLRANTEEGEALDYYSAIDQAHDIAIDVNDRKVIKSVRLVLIALGVYRVITDEQIRNTVTIGNGPKFSFSLNKTKYIFEDHMQ